MPSDPQTQCARTILDVHFQSLDEARGFLQEAKLAIQEQLMLRYLRNYDVVVDETSDSQKDFGAALGIDDPDAMWIEQTFKLYQGLRAGVTARIRWEPGRPKELLVDADTTSRLEDHAMTVLFGTPCLLGGLAGMFSLRWPLLGGVLGVIAGAIVGGLVYALSAAPVFALLLRGARREKQGLARALHKLVRDCVEQQIRSGGFV